ncbi:hypothetical protein DID88_004641 [Monilinia fructigena]|uniref:FAD/NAD(P)-binding domain-containing protein n=1 Tax=Monilinia fructigena TaxID=38457 RepID=A0A395IWR9_9HELO|nr:hypothetical protein DID88_004641 [Monilinia fructigena]
MSSNSNSNSHEVVILGGNFGGVNAVHHLLRQTLPQLHQLDQSKSYHVTLVTPNTSFFFKIASPRALINPSLIPQEKVFRPLSEAFSKVKQATSARAQDYLENIMHVEVINNVRVESTSLTQPGASTTTVKLSDGSSREVDIYIDATGGRVITSDAYFRVKGSGSDDVKCVYVLGDLVAGSSNSALELDPMVTTLCSSLAVDIAGDLGIKKPAEPAPGLLSSAWRLILGSSGNGYPDKSLDGEYPSLLVKFGKAKSFLIELVGPTISGEKWKKA